MNIKCIISKAIKILLNPPALNNCTIDKSSKIGPRTELTNCTIGRYTYIGQQGFIVNTSIGSFCSLADRCSIGGAKHPIHRVSSSPVFHNGKNVMHKNFANFPQIETPLTKIENDVWIATGVIIKAGVTIHNGAVIGAGSVVTRDVPPYEIWAGNPAHKIKSRFEEATKTKLLKSEWWNWSDEKISDKAPLFDNVDSFIESL